MSTTISPDELTSAVSGILQEYSTELAEKTEAVLKKNANECKDAVKSSSPVGDGPTKGRYKKGWAVKRLGKTKGVSNIGGYVVHNKTDYQLTHLLEYGHVGKNQYGKWGDVNAHPHIGDVEKQYVNKCLEDLRKIL